VAAVILLQGVLRDFEGVGEEIIAGASAITTLQVGLSDLEHDVNGASAGLPTDDSGRLEVVSRSLQSNLDALQGLSVVRTRAAGEYAALRRAIDRVVGVAADPAPDQPALVCAITEARRHLVALHQVMRADAQTREQALVTRFRRIVIGLGLAFVVLINGSIALLARMSSMILKPVDRLVDASRRLAREEFDHRIAMDRRDEFGELAAAYNSLAAHLQANEQRRMDVLQQVARTLNHELNNALAIIQLQLDRVSRSRVTGNDAMAQAQPLHEMQEALTRMADTVAALGKVRRIVLTDYASGMKMLDLQASVAE
jgi:methyl-accepting chemotaxis protein